MVKLRGKTVEASGDRKLNEEEVVAFAATLNQIMGENEYWGKDN